MSNNIEFGIIDDFADDEHAHGGVGEGVDGGAGEEIPKDRTPPSSLAVNKGDDFKNDLREYLSKNKPVVYILTPCFASLCYVNYVHCLMATVDLFRKQLNLLTDGVIEMPALFYVFRVHVS